MNRCPGCNRPRPWSNLCRDCQALLRRLRRVVGRPCEADLSDPARQARIALYARRAPAGVALFGEARP